MEDGKRNLPFSKYRADEWKSNVLVRIGIFNLKCSPECLFSLLNSLSYISPSPCFILCLMRNLFLMHLLFYSYSKENEDLSVKARSKFSTSLRSLSQPMSLGEIARTWDVCARRVISEHAQQSGGGSFSSKYGTWENCLTTN